MVPAYKKSASLHDASFFDLDRGQVFQILCIMLRDSIYKVNCKKMFCSVKNPFFSHFLFSSVPPAFSAIPSPSHSSFSVFPSFLIHFLCITPLLSTPIYSAFPPPIFHKHTLYFSLLPSVTLLPSFPPSFSSSALWHFSSTSPSPPLLSVCSLLWLHHPILCVSLTLIFTPHLDCHSVYILLSVCTAVILPFKRLFKTYCCMVLNVDSVLLQHKCQPM